LTKNFIIQQLTKEFTGRASFTRKELFDFYLRYDPELKENTFRWRIYNLKEAQLISPISRGLFTLDYKPVYKPEIDKNLKRFSANIEKQFPSMRFCLWPTRILNEFMLHQPGRHIMIIEAEKDALEHVFHYMKDKDTKSVYLLPTARDMEWYINEEETAIIIEPLISKAPIQTVNGTPTVTLEKMIVDLFADQKLFSTFQGSELINIINTAYKRYQLDFTTLFSYAKRRRKEKDLMKYLSQFTEIPQTILHDRS
jgi:hypothetical protein